MVDPLLHKIYNTELTQEDFNRLSSFIYQESGIKMPPIKKVMLQSRLQKRLRELSFHSFTDYCNYVFSKDGSNEIIHMLDVVSTNKTDFFRESVHFDFLTSVILPEFLNSVKFNKTIKIWSAGCSSGEEPYTIAMVLYEFLEKSFSLDFSILGTDISTKILQKAVSAVYKEERVECVPYHIKQKYMLRSKNRSNPTVKIAPQVRNKVRFERLNFMDDYYNLKENFDIVFCRNVLIYFDRETQEKVINKICLRINVGGYFFLGHSESILNMKVPLKQVKPTIFQRV